MATNGPRQEGLTSGRIMLTRRVIRLDPDAGKNIHHSFGLRDDFRSLTERSKVELTLNERLNKPPDILELTDYVVGDAQRVFLLLIRSDAINYIRDLQRAGFTDDDLPVIRRKSKDGSAVFIHKRLVNDNSANTEEKILTCFLGWDESKLEVFFENQWVFLTPVFTPEKFAYVFHSQCPLPYMPLQHSDTSPNQENSDTIRDLETTDVERFFEKERDTLKEMRDRDHQHLIKAVAAYKKGPERCFVFPRAQGGSLRDFWRTHPAALDEQLVSWTIDQMIGLSDGLKQLHKFRTRHGDLKPDNILCFTYVNGSPHKWTLVLADVSLAKFHPAYTRDRTKYTSTRHGTKIYEPPEMFTNQGWIKVSRKYDIWSLGCVFLEFTIWLLYGRGGLALFHNTLFEKHMADGFWKNDPTQGPRLHPVAEDWIDKILNKDLKGDSALRALVELVVAKLLVPKIEQRATTRILCDELFNIQSTKGLFNSELRELAKHRGGSDFIAEDDMTHSSIERTSTLHNQWRNMTDSECARTIISRLDWSSLRPRADMTRICHSCAALDFELRTLDLHRSIEELGKGSDECSLCQFLFLCLAKARPMPDEPVTLFRDRGSPTLRVCPSATPVISIYPDPASEHSAASDAQLGLPILPNCGSPQQFKLLNEWIYICDTAHNCTSYRALEGRIDSMPTRVIDVGTVESPCLRLVETGDSVRGKYIALSHCWGKLNKGQKFVTSASNLDSRKEGISFDEMPKSFQDAVRVTRALGVAYLWIDSLCIIQEDEADWQVESAKMEEVFSSAYCTIAASYAKSSLDGFLGDRTPRACVTIQHSQRPMFYLAEAIDDFQTHVEQSVLNSRGWVLQERALSRRTIHFTSTQVYWECGEGVYCETLTQLQNPQSQFLGDSSFPNSGLQYYNNERIQLVQHLYQSYCTLQLTNATDRSKAILGLQKRLSQTFRSRADFGIFWAAMERTILWRAKTPNGLSRIPYRNKNRVPSWSWMACAGEIQYMDIPFGQANWMGNPANPTGTIPEGEEWDGQLTARASRLLIDEDELLGRAIIDCSTFKFDSAVWRCVVVGKSEAENQSGDVDHYILLIRPLGGSVHVYERVGVGKILGKHVSKKTTRVHLG